MERRDLVSQPWKDYELLDSGENRKLERFGKYTLVRPETQALWSPEHPDGWKHADAEFKWTSEKGSWQSYNLPEFWELSWSDTRFTVRPTSFKHIGIFPEQATNWEWIGSHAKSGMNVLNLFGYTGIASIVAAKKGARVTHVDASKQSNSWAKENAALSGVPDGGIRFLLDDALAFALRETRRGAKYDGIILDPPAFGRGAKGEVWRIEEHLAKLLSALEKIFAPGKGSFFLLNGYAAGYSPTSFLQAARSAFTKELTSAMEKNGEFGELATKESRGARIVPSGIYLRFTR